MPYSFPMKNIIGSYSIAMITVVWLYHDVMLRNHVRMYHVLKLLNYNVDRYTVGLEFIRTYPTHNDHIPVNHTILTVKVDQYMICIIFTYPKKNNSWGCPNLTYSISVFHNVLLKKISELNIYDFLPSDTWQLIKLL